MLLVTAQQDGIFKTTIPKKYSGACAPYPKTAIPF